MGQRECTSYTYFCRKFGSFEHILLLPAFRVGVIGLHLMTMAIYNHTMVDELQLPHIPACGGRTCSSAGYVSYTLLLPVYHSDLLLHICQPSQTELIQIICGKHVCIQVLLCSSQGMKMEGYLCRRWKAAGTRNRPPQDGG